MMKTLKVLVLFCFILILSCNVEESSNNIENLNSIQFSKIQIKDTIFYSRNSTLNNMVKSELRGKVQVYGNPKEVENFIEYLGKIKIESKNYFVISKYSTIQLAISKKGRSFVLFLDENKNEVKSYNLEMPNNLPTSIQGNKLVFNINGLEKSLILDKELPIRLCLPENLGCYE